MNNVTYFGQNCGSLLRARHIPIMTAPSTTSNYPVKSTGENARSWPSRFSLLLNMSSNAALVSVQRSPDPKTSSNSNDNRQLISVQSKPRVSQSSTGAHFTFARQQGHFFLIWSELLKQAAQKTCPQSCSLIKQFIWFCSA
jgi:hypothetical protein